LNVGYLLPLVVRGFFAPVPAAALGSAATYAPGSAIKEAPLLCVLPPLATGIGCIILFFFAEPIYRLIESITSP